MFDNLAFHAMESSIAALRMKQEAMIHNLANLETPGYKAKQVSFEDLLEEARGKEGSASYHFAATVSTNERTAVRPDGNNVDVDKENLELMDSYFQSAALYQKLSGQIVNMRYVIGQAFK